MVNDVTVEGQFEGTPIQIVVKMLLAATSLSVTLYKDMIEHGDFYIVYSLLNEAMTEILANGTSLGTLFKFIGDFFATEKNTFLKM